MFAELKAEYIGTGVDRAIEYDGPSSRLYGEIRFLPLGTRLGGWSR